jgi:nucleosome binding factor SPN SPT16 subunit
MKCLIEHVEHLVDQDDMRPVVKISQKIEALLDSDLSKFTSKLHQQVDTQLLEFAFSPSIQA